MSPLSSGASKTHITPDVVLIAEVGYGLEIDFMDPMHSELRDPISAFYMICAAIFIIELHKNSPIIGRIDDASTCYDPSPV